MDPPRLGAGRAGSGWNCPSAREGETERWMSDEEDRPLSSDDLLTPPETTDPHELVHWLRGIDVGLRYQYQTRLVELIRTRPAAEQETLLHIIKEIGFPLTTMRQVLKLANKEAGARFKIQPTYVGKNKEGRSYLAEMIYRPEGTPLFGFLVQWLDDPEGSPEFYEKLQADDGVEIHPLATKLVEGGTVLLPSTYEEYGTDHELFLEIRNFINSFVHLDDTAFRTMACCYVMLSWMHDRFYALPYLRAHGDYGTGKSRLIQVVGSICYRPILAGGATTASPIFRIIQRLHGTLVIDEADFSKSDLWEEIVKILNAGYQRGQGHVLRSERAGEGEPFDVHAYDCYGPKILSTRKKFSDAALESRCFSHTMPLIKNLKEDMPFVLDEEFFGRAQRLRNQLLLWRLRNYNRVKVNSRERLPGLKYVEPRAVQIMQPVLACTASEAVKRTVLDEAIKYAKQMDTNRQEGLEGVAAQAAIHFWDLQRKPRSMLLKTVTEYLQSRGDTKDIKSRTVGALLRNVGIDVRPSGGEACVFLSEELAQRVAGHYGVERHQITDAPSVAADAPPPGPGA